MKSNREAKRLLGLTFNISRRRIVTKSEWTGLHITVKPSASQNRAKQFHKRYRASLREGE